MKIDPSEISLRKAKEDDREFAFEVKKAALRAYIEPIWGWDESFQIEFHRNDWIECRPDIVRFDGRDIGTIEILRRDGELHLGEFYLFPAFQRQGIGSHLVAELAGEADAKGIPVRLEVIKINPVQSLYLRFGFTVVGETNTHYLMERKPIQSAQATPVSAPR